MKNLHEFKYLERTFSEDSGMVPVRKSSERQANCQRFKENNRGKKINLEISP